MAALRRNAQLRTGALSEFAVRSEVLPADLIIVEFEAKLSYVLDLTSVEALHTLSVNLGSLHRPDLAYTQSIAEAARIAGCEGVLVPSIRHGRSPLLVVFDRISHNSHVQLIKSRHLKG